MNLCAAVLLSTVCGPFLTRGHSHVNIDCVAAEVRRSSPALSEICANTTSYDGGCMNGTVSFVQTVDYFSLCELLKGLIPKVIKTLHVSTRCALRPVLENLLLGEGFFADGEIKHTLAFENCSHEHCCTAFHRLPRDLTATTSLEPCVNVTDVLTPPVLLRKVLLDVTRLVDWDTACVLYSEEYMTMADLFIGVLSENEVKLWLYSLPNTEDALVTILTSCYYSMRNTGINFVLLTSQSSLVDILTKMNAYSRQQGILVKLALMSRWLVWTDGTCISCIVPRIQNVSNVSILQRKFHNGLGSSNYTGVPLYEVVTAFWQTTGRQFGRVITWSADGQISVHGEVFPNVKLGLNNVTLILTTKEWSPFTIKTTINGEVHFEGICLDIMDEMARRLNFSYIVVEPPDGQWGLKMLSGNWTGMIAQLANREVDIMIGAVSIQQEREEVMDFIHPFYNDYTTLLLKKPDKNLEKWKLLVNPLHWTVVVCVVFALPLMTVLVSVVEKYHPCYTGADRTHLRGLHRFDDCLWYNLAALLNEGVGGQESPRDHAGRTMVASWWLFTIVLVASYTSTLTAALAVEKEQLPFNTIEEMVEQTHYRWGGTNGSYMFMLFEKSDNEVFRKIWEGLQRFLKDHPDTLNKEHAVHVAQVRAGGYVLFNDKSKNLIEASQDCDLALAEQEFLPLNFAIGLQQDSPYRHLFEHHMIGIVESGLLELWESRWWPDINNCTASGPAIVKPISISDVQGGYLVLGIGLVVSLFVFTMERVVQKSSGRCRCSLCKL